MQQAKAILVLLLFFLCAVSLAQINPQYIRKIEFENGLYGNDVTDIIQDSDGNMWFATNEGVSKFDGSKFTHYQRNLKKTELPTNSAYHLFEDAEKHIWICTHLGISKYYPEKDKFEIFMHDTLPGTISNPLISCGLQDSKGDFWFTAWDNLNKLTPDGFEKVKGGIDILDEGEPLGYVMDIIEIPGRKLLLSTFYYGLIVFDIETQLFSRFSEEYTSNRTQEILLNDNSLFIGTWSHSLIQFDFDGNILKRFNTSHKDGYTGNTEIMSIAYSNGQFYLGSQNGIKVLNKKTGKVFHYLHYENEEKIDKFTNQVFADDNGGIWFGGRKHLLTYLPPFYHIFSHIQTTNGISLDEYQNYVDRLYITKNKELLFQSDKELLLLKSFNKEAVKIKIPFATDQNIALNTLFDNYGNFGIFNEGVFYQVNSINGEIKFTKKIEHNALMSSLWIDNQNRKWVGSTRSIYLYDTSNTLVKIYNEKDGMYDPQQMEAFEFQDGTIGITSANVIYKHIPESDSFYTFLNKSGYRFCDYDKKGRLVFRSREGIYIFDQDTFINYSISHGLPANRILNIEIDENNIAWISTSNGLSRFDIETESFKNFNVNDGLISNQFLGSINYRDNILVVSHNKGITKFDVRDLGDIPSNGNLIFTDFLIQNSPVLVADEPKKGEYVLPRHISKTQKIVVPAKFNVLSFKFSLLDFYDPKKNTYDYLLEGFDLDWRFSGTNNSITYTNLEAGKYILYVRAYNGDGVLSPNQAKLEIEILPFWYQTIWFRLLLSIFTMSVISGFYIWRVASLRKRQILLEKQVKERTAEISLQKEEISTQADNLLQINTLLKDRQEKIELQAEVLTNLNATKDKFFSIIAHDLKNPFQGIIGFTDILRRDYVKLEDKKKLELIDMIRGTSEGAFALLENLLQWARSQTQTVEFSPVTLDVNHLVYDTFSLLKLNAGNKKIALVSDISGKHYAFADKNMMLTVIRNLVNNAIKFTPANGEITVKAFSENDFVIIKVIDTGQGMSKELVNNLFKIDKVVSKKGTDGESGTGLGLIICKEFIEKNNGTISIESDLGRGSTFTIKLPVLQDSFVEKKKDAIQHKIIEVVDENNSDNEEVAEKKIALLVDDDANLRFSMKNYLAETFYIHEADNGSVGLAMAKELMPDIIISDVMMPEMDGIEMSKLLKEDQKTSHIPIVLLTARISEDHMLQGLQTGADDYINKPVSLKVLEVKVRNLIAIRQKLREEFDLNLPVSGMSITNAKDKEFLEVLTKLVETDISNSELNFELISKQMGMSKTQLYRKLKALTNQTVNEFVRTFRIKKAALEISLNSGKNISEIAYMYGFNDPKYFSKSFKEIFKMTPSEYQQLKKK